jgi:hypothetical protein
MRHFWCSQRTCGSDSDGDLQKWVTVISTVVDRRRLTSRSLRHGDKGPYHYIAPGTMDPNLPRSLEEDRTKQEVTWRKFLPTIIQARHFRVLGSLTSSAEVPP